MNTYAEEIYEPEQVITATKQLGVISDTKYENADLNKVTENQCQHITESQLNEILKLLQNFKEFFDGALGY